MDLGDRPAPYVSWNNEKLVSWLLGLDDFIKLYADNFRRSNFSGKWISTADYHDLEQLGINIIGHQLIILDRLFQLQSQYLLFDNETMGNLLFKLSVAASNVVTDIALYLSNLENFHSTKSPFLKFDGKSEELRIYSDVLKLNSVVMNLVLWIDRAPFATMPDMSLLRTFLIKNTFNISSGTKSALKHLSIQNFPTIKSEAEAIQKKVEAMLHDCSDSIFYTACGFEIVQIKRSEIAPDFGLKFRSTCNIQHLIVQVKPESPAFATGKVSKGDEIVEVNGQVVIGWDHSKVAELMITNPRLVTLRLRKRPQHSTDFPGYQSGARRQRLAVIQQNPNMKIVSSHRNALIFRTPKRVEEEFESPNQQKLNTKNDSQALKSEEFHEYSKATAFEFPNGSGVVAAQSSISTPNSPFLGPKSGIHGFVINHDEPNIRKKKSVDAISSSVRSIPRDFDENKNLNMKITNIATPKSTGCGSSVISNEDEPSSKGSSSRSPGEKGKFPETPSKNFLNSGLLKPKKTNRRISCKDLGQGDCQGWLLLKKSNSFSSKYVKRWCICKHNTLYYYRNPEDESAEGLILLHGFTVSPRPEIKSGRYAFRVYNDWVRFVFASESEQDRSKWMNKLGLAAIGLSAAVRTARIGGFHPGYVITPSENNSPRSGDELRDSTLELVMRNSLGSNNDEEPPSVALIQALQMRISSSQTSINSATSMRSQRKQLKQNALETESERNNSISEGYVELHLEPVNPDTESSEVIQDAVVNTNDVQIPLNIPVPQIRFYSVIDQPQLISETSADIFGRRKSAELIRISDQISLQPRRASLLAGLPSNIDHSLTRSTTQNYYSESSEEAESFCEDAINRYTDDQLSDSSSSSNVDSGPFKIITSMQISSNGSSNSSVSSGCQDNIVTKSQNLNKRRSVTITAPDGQESFLPYRLPPSAQNEESSTSSNDEPNEADEKFTTMTVTLVPSRPMGPSNLSHDLMNTEASHNDAHSSRSRFRSISHEQESFDTKVAFDKEAIIRRKNQNSMRAARLRLLMPCVVNAFSEQQQKREN